MSTTLLFQDAYEVGKFVSLFNGIYCLVMWAEEMNQQLEHNFSSQPLPVGSLVVILVWVPSILTLTDTRLVYDACVCIYSLYLCTIISYIESTFYH